MRKIYEKELTRLIDELFDIHIELWDVVDMKKSDDDKIVALAARNNNRLVKLRSDCVEQIDEIVIRLLNLRKQGGVPVNETIGNLIEQLGFEKIHIHETNQKTASQDKSTPKCEELKERLQHIFDSIIG